MNYDNYIDLSIISPKKPPNAHLLFEQGSVLILVDSADPDYVYYSIDKGATWTVISSGVTHDNIINAWHDQTNKFIYFQASTGVPSNATYKLDASDADPSNWTIAEIGANINHIGLDIWIRDGNLEQLICDTVELDLEVWRWTDPNWVEIADSAVQTTHIYSTKAVVIGTDVYFVYADVLGDPSMYKFTGAAITKLDDIDVANREVPENYTMQGMAYDGNDIIYFNTANLANDTYYYTTYAITADTMTEHGEHKIGFQLDRNTASGVKEKAFHLTEYKIYKIQENNTQLYLISIPATDAIIITITDNYFMNNEGDIFEFTNNIKHLSSVFIHHQIQEAPYAVVEVFNQGVNLEKNMFMTFKHEYTTAGSTSEEIIFEGIIQKFSEGKNQKIMLVSPAKREIKNIKPSGDYTKDSDGLMSQILIDYNNYITAGTLTDGADLGTLTLGGEQTEETIFDDCAEFEGWIWYLNPTGKLYFNNGTTDSTINYTEASGLSNVKQDHVHEEFNRIKVIGAYVSGTQAVSDWDDDLASQQAVGINEKIISITILNTNALCDTAAANLLTILAKDPKKVIFSTKDTTAGYIQVGETITFEYSVGETVISSDQYLITSAVIDKYGVITYVIIDELT